MKNTPHQTVAKILCLVTAAVATASCSKDSKPAEPPRDKEARKLQFNVVDVSLTPFSDNKYETKPGCPWMPQDTINNMTPLDYEMRWKVADYPHSTIYRCEVVKPNTGPKISTAWTSSVIALKKDLTADSFKNDPEPGTSGRFLAADNPYAGDNFHLHRKGSLDAIEYWRCGKYLITYSSYPNTGRGPLQNASGSYPRSGYSSHYRLNGNRFLETNIKQLCGTKTNPTKAVTDYPYIAWHTYRSSQNTNPESYGVKKPADLKGINFSPRKSARPTPTKKSTTSTNTSKP